MTREGGDLRAELATLGPTTLADLKRMAQDNPAAFYRALAMRPDLASLTHCLSMMDGPATARLRVLRALHDLESTDGG